MIRTLLFLVLAAATFASAAGERKFVSQKLVNAAAYYPEGPQIITEGLLVAEMPKDRIVLLNDAGARTVWSQGSCGPTSIKKIPSGGYWVLCHLGHYVVRLGPAFQTVRRIDQTEAGRRIIWPNDASVDNEGNLYLSSSGWFSLQAPAQGSVVYIGAADNSVRDMVGGLRYTNGVLVQESRGRVLVSEHLNRRVLSFPLLGKGQLGQPSVFFDFSQAPAVNDAYERSGPDGMAAFANGDIFVTDYGNGRILLLSEQGRFIEQLAVRYRFVTNLAISADEKTMFVLMTQSNGSADLHGVVEAYTITGK